MITGRAKPLANSPVPIARPHKPGAAVAGVEEVEPFDGGDRSHPTWAALAVS